MLIPNASEMQSRSIGGTHFPFVEYGERDERPPLVLLHGISMPPTHWGQFPKDMGRYAVAIGLPLNEPEFTMPTMRLFAKKMVPAIHEIASGDNPYDLLGLSWGGQLAQQIAIKDRKNVHGLVLAGTMPAILVPFLGIPDIQATKAVWSTERSTDNTAAIYGGDFRNNPALIDEMSELIHRPINKLNHLRQLYAASLSGPLITQRMLAFFSQPETLVMAGDDDPIVPYLSVQLGAFLLGMKMETMHNGGHGFLLTRPEQSARIVNDFLVGI